LTIMALYFECRINKNAAALHDQLTNNLDSYLQSNQRNDCYR